MRKISADIVFPVSSNPIKNGVVIIDEEGKVLSVDERKSFGSSELEIYNGIISPGFINAHCHLELSYMRGKIPEKKGIGQFIIDLIDYRNGFALADEGGESTDIRNEIRNAEQEMIANGIVGVGDISNDDFTFFSKSVSPLRYHTFIECFGFDPDKAGKYFQQAVNLFEKAHQMNLSASITPHAPYSVPPELFELIFSFRENQSALFSYHNQESESENIFFESGQGDFLKVFDHFKLPQSFFDSTGINSLTSVISYFPKRDKVLFVHNTASTRKDISLMASHCHKAYWCFCPNANLYIENRLPDFSLFKEYPDRLCLGTDSLASNHQLSVLEEMKTIQLYDSTVSTAELLQWATLNGANFFGWNDQLGSIEGGKKPGFNLITPVDKTGKLIAESKVIKLI